MFDVILLGSGGTIPLHTRALTSCFVRIFGTGFLFDCGEGTQVQIQKSEVSASDIDYICISHLHADHVSGLVGVLLALKTAGREKVITIIGPKNIKEVLNSFQYMFLTFPFQIKFIELSVKNASFELKIESESRFGDIILRSVVGSHSVYCFGYSVELKRKAAFNIEKASQTPLPKYNYKRLCDGHDVEYEGVLYKSVDFIGAPRKGLKFSYVVDTRPFEGLREFIKDSDIAILDGMYRDEEDFPKAKKNKHMMWREAIEVAQGIVGKLVLAHFSPSLILKRSDQGMVKALMQDCELGVDGAVYNLNYQE